jgi:transposase
MLICIMFIRSIKVRSSSGAVHEYVRIVESIRQGGRVRQKVVANLGRRDTLTAVLPMLKRFLQGDEEPSRLAQQLGQEGDIQVEDASTWGPMLVARYLFARLGVWQVLDAGRRWPKLLRWEDPCDDWPSRVLALVCNRLVRPGSEHALGAWLESDYVCDRDGRRYVPQWKRRGRVQVDLVQLQRWYRTLDHLLLNKETIEVALYQRLRTLFEFQPDLVLYDLTSTYFTGHGPAIAKHGYSRDGKPRNVQVVVGVVMVAGWPIAHHVWAGNTRDSSTVKEVVADLSKRFQFRRVVFVGDRGMVTETNLKALQGGDDAWGFLVGMTRRQNPEVESLIDRASEAAWLECPGGINTQEKPEDRRPRTRVQEVPCDRLGVRVFVVDSDERRAYEQRMREKAMQRVRTGLEKVQARVAQGRLKNPAKIGAAVERVLQRDHGYRYYDWQWRDGRLNIVEHPVNLPREKKYEGKYLIQTDQPQFTPEEAVAHYKELNDVERGFHALKDPLGMRPIWHRVERRVRAHVFIAALAFLLDRMLERALREAGSGLSSRAAWTALETVRHVRFRVHGEARSGVTPGSSRAREVLGILKITDLRPPTPPSGDETTM